MPVTFWTGFQLVSVPVRDPGVIFGGILVCFYADPGVIYCRIQVCSRAGSVRDSGVILWDPVVFPCGFPA